MTTPPPPPADPSDLPNPAGPLGGDADDEGAPVVDEHMRLVFDAAARAFERNWARDHPEAERG